VTDPRTRDDLLSAMRQGCPLCVLVERAERKAIDHFLYDQVNDIRQRDALRASRGMCLPHTAKLAAKTEPQAACPMCAERPRVEAPLYAGLLHNLRDAAFAAEFDASGGLCRVHLAGGLRAADAEAARGLAARQAAIWRRLEAVLDEFIRKHDYRFREPLLDDERDVWRRALQASSGWYK
jgi:hypothetical protein